MITVVPGGKFFSDLVTIWSTLIKDKANQASFNKTFPLAGYYVVTLPENKKHKIIVLNSVLLSSHINSKHIHQAAVTEFKWLDRQLSDLKENQEAAILADHIPIGLDAYATLKTSFRKIIQFWQPVFTTQFETTINQYPEFIKAVFSGHIHNEMYQIITVNKFEKIPMYITPSISPIYGNNPGFKVFDYDQDTFKILSHEFYYFPLDEIVTNATWTK